MFDMDIAEIADFYHYAAEQEFRERAYLQWILSFSGLDFDEFCEAIRPKAKERIRPSEEILAETDRLFEGGNGFGTV